MLSHAGRNVLVTGAARGIGRACAVLMAEHGARVTACDVLDCDETAALAGAYEGEVHGRRCDVSDEASVNRLFAEALAGRPLHTLVHCAGIILEKPLLDTSLDDFRAVIDINLTGSFLIGREALRRMHSQGFGQIILVASDLSYYGRESFSAYVASKHAVLGLVRSWAHEFAPRITVNAICPGPVDTDMLGAAHMSATWREKERDIPLQRFGDPAEIAQMALYLASPHAAFITGQGMSVNGGSVMV